MAYEDKKEHKGRKYSGMRVGGVHSWTYPDGTWHEKKVEPDKWGFFFSSHKNRQRRAPEGSGAGVGSAYHWYITAHQWVKKLDANTYATLMEGDKRLIGFQKPEWKVWNTQFRNQRSSRQRVIAALEETLAQLKEQEESEAVMENPWDLPLFDVGDLESPVVEELVPAEVLER